MTMKPNLMPHRVYNIPNSSPPVSLSLETIDTRRFNPTIALLSMIENMQPVCRHFVNAMPRVRVFDYALIRTTIQNSYLPCGTLTYNVACTALRGLAEYMTLSNVFIPWRFQIWVNGYAVGRGQIEGISRTLPAVSGVGIATS